MATIRPVSSKAGNLIVDQKGEWRPRKRGREERKRKGYAQTSRIANVSSFATTAGARSGKLSGISVSEPHDHDEGVNTSFAARLRFFLITSWAGVVLDVADAIFSIVACLMYVAETYYDDNGIPEFLTMSEVVLCMFFLAHFGLHFFVSPNRFYFLASFQSLIDMLIIFPPLIFFAIRHAGDTADGEDSEIVSALENNNFFVMMRIFRVLRIIRVSRELGKSANFDSEIAQIFFDTGIMILTGVLIFTGLIHWIENIDYTGAWGLPALDNGAPLCPQDLRFHPNPASVDFDGCRNKILYHDALYFLMVTVSTVGYGDMSPQTVPGRLSIIIMIAVFLLQIPVITNKLAEAFSQFSYYERAVYKSKRSGGGHVIICGSANERPILEFMQELFHPDHRNPSLNVVILAQGSPSKATLRLLNSVKFRARTFYLDGDPVSMKDLERASAETAEHFFIVADPMAANPEQEDSQNTLRALAIKQYVYSHGGKKATISIQMLRHESRGTYYDSVKVADYARAAREKDDHDASSMLLDQVICLDEIKLSLMAQGAGICTMVSNLCTSMSVDKIHTGGYRWASEYLDGCDYEVYRIWLSPVFEGAVFQDVAEQVHRETGVLIFALELHSPRGLDNATEFSSEEIDLRNSLPPRIALNPSNFIIPSIVEYRVHAFVIAGDRSDAVKVQNWGLPKPEDSFDWRQAVHALKNISKATFKSVQELPAHIIHHYHRRHSVNNIIGEDGVQTKTTPSVYAQDASSTPENNVPKDLPVGNENKRHSLYALLNPNFLRRKSGIAQDVERDEEVEARLMSLARSQVEADEKELKQNALIEAKKQEDQRKKTVHVRRMQKLRKFAVKVGGEQYEARTSAESGEDHRAYAARLRVLRERRRRELMGSALSESTWERLGANFSTLSAERKVPLHNIIIETVKHLDRRIHHHIIACGPLSALWSFILPLRSKHVQVVQPIVVLDRNLPSEEEWKRFARFPDIYLVRGSPLNIKDLHAAGASTASRAVLFAHHTTSQKSRGVIPSAFNDKVANAVAFAGEHKFARQMQDSDTILSYRALKVVNSRINVTVELVSSENLRLLDESEMGSGQLLSNKMANILEDASAHEQSLSESWLSPSFASGHAFLSTVVDTIFAQSFYNRHLIAIIQELVIGTPDVLTNAWDKVLGSEIGNLHDSHLYLVMVPKEFHGRTYGYTLYSLLKRGALAMGLRRGIVATDESKIESLGFDPSKSHTQPYVYTNPTSSTLIRNTDLLYVLCHGAPQDYGLCIALFDYSKKRKETVSSYVNVCAFSHFAREGGLRIFSLSRSLFLIHKTQYIFF